MSETKLGLALCGSYCTFDKVLPIAESLSEEFELTAIMSESAAETDTRFGCAENIRNRLQDITGKDVIRTIAGAEPVGPMKLFDVIAVAPCTGNTLAKLACGIADTAVTMACKAHLRNGRPIVIAVSTNDALGANAKNIGELLNRKNIYFVPFRQDDPKGKPTSMVAELTLLADTVREALEGRQLQPVILGFK